MTSPTLLGLASPVPVVPTPANAWTPRVTTKYITSRRTVEMIAARPGLRVRSAVSSLTETDVSQPQ